MSPMPRRPLVLFALALALPLQRAAAADDTADDTAADDTSADGDDTGSTDDASSDTSVGYSVSEVTGEKGGCGCATGTGAGAGLAALTLGVLGAAVRRRAGGS